MPRCCDRLEQLCMDGEYLAPYMAFLNGFMKQLGKFLVIAVHVITIFLAFTSFAIILPYEQWYQNFGLLTFYFWFGNYLLFNIMYHYTKARTLAAVTTAGKQGDRWCHRCEYYKSDRTHHCAICQKCVLGMDHHCIWINQCVGSHNHRHFFLFIANLTVASAVIVVAGYHTIWDHLWMLDRHYCSNVLDFAPLQGYICDHGEMARNCIIFCYLLAFMLMLLVGGLTIWNMFLISKGFTYIDYLQHSEIASEHSGYKNPLDRGIRANWRNFLGLNRNRSFFRYVLLPSAHAPILYDSYGRIERVEHVV